MKKIILIIQGEGRGHLTQAIEFKNLAEKHNFIIPLVMVGSSTQRKLPAYFFDTINVPVYTFESPNFITDAKFKKIKIFRSIVYNLLKLPTFIRSIKFIKKIIDTEQPEIIINFYEPLVGLLNFFYKKTKTISIAHQYIYLNKNYQFPKGFTIERIALKWFTKLTAIGSEKIFALSQYTLKSSNTKLIVVPPILRQEIKQLQTSTQDFYLIYLLNNGLSDDIMQWHSSNCDIKLHCFWDKTDVPEEYVIHKNLIFHKLNNKKFIELMADCKGLISTAGFESICEAAYLEKPIMIVPVEGHFEQYCNVHDFSKAGLAFYSKTFSLDHFIMHYRMNTEKINLYKEWCKNDTEILNTLIKIIEK